MVVLWLFYIQHNFEGVYWSRHDGWDRMKSIKSSWASAHLKNPRPDRISLFTIYFFSFFSLSFFFPSSSLFFSFLASYIFSSIIPILNLLVIDDQAHFSSETPSCSIFPFFDRVVGLYSFGNFKGGSCNP